ncbi:unnamed protein product [Bathycoccus prasinos]
MPILTIKRRRISSSSGREKYIGSHTRSETMIQTTSFASSSSSSLRCCNCCFYHHHRWTEKFLKRRGLRKTPLVRSRAKEEEEDDSDATTKTTSGEETRTPVSLAKLNTSPRRIVLAMTSTTALALGANFLGITSLFLRVNEPLARKLKLDTVYEVSGYRRDRNDEKGYEFLFPNEYLADQTIARRNAMRKAQTLDLPSLRDTKGQKNVGEPESAFGPMGTNGEENMSVIVQTSTKGFDLGQFGDAEEQASWLLENALARPGSGKEAKLFSAARRSGRMESNIISSSIRSRRRTGIGETSPFLRRIRKPETCIRLWRSVQWRDGTEWEKSSVNRQTRFAFLRRNRRAFDDDE